MWRHGAAGKTHACAGWHQPPAETVSMDPGALCVDCHANLRRRGCGGLCSTCYPNRHTGTDEQLPRRGDRGDVPTEPTYRQLDYWTSQGYLRPDVASPGSGYVRQWPAAERRIAATMARLTAAGIPPKVAHDVARAGGRLEIAPGVVVEVNGV